jgi:hypothetical protein
VKDIIQLLIARLGLVPGVLESKVFNNQIQRQKDEGLSFYPQILVELLNVTYEEFNGGTDVQYGNAEVRVHIVNESLTQGEDYDIYNLKDLVHQYLHRYDGDGKFNPLVRTQETLDADHDNLYDYQITYTFRFAEETQPLPSDDTPDFPFDYTLTGDL